MTAEPTPSEDFWEPRYRDADPEAGRHPNARLAELVPGLSLLPQRVRM